MDLIVYGTLAVLLLGVAFIGTFKFMDEYIDFKIKKHADTRITKQ